MVPPTYFLGDFISMPLLSNTEAQLGQTGLLAAIPVIVNSFSLA